MHNALQPTARQFVPAANVSNQAHFQATVSTRSEYPDLSAIVSPLITTTATSHPPFFDDRDHLLTGMAVDNTERGRFASTSLPHMVTDLSNCLHVPCHEHFPSRRTDVLHYSPEHHKIPQRDHFERKQTTERHHLVAGKEWSRTHDYDYSPDLQKLWRRGRWVSIVTTTQSADA